MNSEAINDSLPALTREYVGDLHTFVESQDYGRVGDMDTLISRLVGEKLNPSLLSSTSTYNNLELIMEAAEKASQLLYGDNK